MTETAVICALVHRSRANPKIATRLILLPCGPEGRKGRLVLLVWARSFAVANLSKDATSPLAGLLHLHRRSHADLHDIGLSATEPRRPFGLNLEDFLCTLDDQTKLIR